MAVPKIILVDPETESYCEKFSDWNNKLVHEIERDTRDKLAYDDMLSGYQTAGLLRMLIKISGARKAAEVGSFTGFATLAMAEALPADGKLYALEMNTRYLSIAEENLRKSDVFHKVEILFGNARERVHELPDDLDFIFLDADKDFYIDYYRILLPKLRRGGILVIDNVLWYGGVLKDEKDRKSATIHKLNELVHQDSTVEQVMLSVRDGLYLIRKL